MKKSKSLKKILVLLVALMMVINFLPVSTAFAEDTLGDGITQEESASDEGLPEEGASEEVAPEAETAPSGEAEPEAEGEANTGTGADIEGQAEVETEADLPMSEGEQSSSEADADAAGEAQEEVEAPAVEEETTSVDATEAAPEEETDVETPEDVETTEENQDEESLATEGQNEEQAEDQAVGKRSMLLKGAPTLKAAPPAGLPDNVVYLTGDSTDPNTNVYNFLKFNAEHDTIEAFEYTVFQAMHVGKIAYVDIPVYYSDGSTAIKKISNDAFSGCSLYNVNFDENSEITEIGSNAFYNNNISKIKLPSKITNLGVSAFNTNPITEIDLSACDNLKVIPKYSFQSSVNYESLALPKYVEEIGNQAFYDNYHEKQMLIEFPETIKSIGDTAFWGYYIFDLTKTNRSQLGDNFWGNSFGSIIRFSNEEVDTTTNTCFVFDKVNKKIVSIKEDAENYSDWNGGNLVIPNEIGGVKVEGLYSGAFAINNPQSKIKSIKFEEGTNIKEIPYWTFCGTFDVDYNAEGIEKIGKHNHRHLSNTSFTYPESLTELGEYGWTTRTGQIESITFLGDKLQSLPNTLVSGNVVKDIYLLNYEKDSIGEVPFGAKNATIHWKNNEVTLPEIMISDDGLWEIEPAANRIVRYLGDDSTNDYWDGTTFKVPSTVKAAGKDIAIKIVKRTIGSGFQNTAIIEDRNLLSVEKKLVISDGIEVIGGFDDNNITSIEFPKSIVEIYNMRNNPLKKNLDLSELTNLKVLTSQAFRNCQLEGEIIIPGNITNINPVFSIFPFADNPDLTAIRVRQYREHSEPNGDGEYIEGEKYLKAPKNILEGIPYDLDKKYGLSVYFVDDPQYLYDEKISPNVENNTVDIIYNLYTNKESYLIKQFDNDDTLKVNPYELNQDNGMVKSEVKLTASKNGKFISSLDWGLKNFDETNITSYLVSNVNLFHNVIYNANGGTGSTVDNKSPYVEGYAKAEAVENNFRNDKKVFLGWDTNKSKDKDPAYKEGATLPAMGTKDLTLYAIWGPDENENGVDDRVEAKYSVTYQYLGEVPSGVTVPAKVENKAEKDVVTLPEIPTVEGYILYPEGWQVVEPSGLTINNGTITIGTADVKLAAVWHKDENGDEIPDSLQVLVKYESTDETKGKVLGEVWDEFTGKASAKTVNVTTKGRDTEPAENYAVDQWTHDYEKGANAKHLGGGVYKFGEVELGTKITIKVSFDSDTKGDPEDPDNKGDGIPDKYQVYVKYEAGENGTVEGKGEVFTSEKNEDGTYKETVSFTTVADVTVVPDEGYALDKWTNDLDEQTSADGKFTFSDVAVGSTIVATANFDSDSKGDPEDPDNKGDGIPDKYQVYVKYEAGENGTVEGKGEVFTSEKNEDGTYKETVSFTTVADVTVVPDEGYALDKWTNDLDEQTSADGKFTFSDVAVGSTIVATANFDSDSKGDPEDPDNKGDGIPDKYQVYVKYEAGENGTVEGKGEVFTSEKNEDGTYAETVSFTTVADVTVMPDEGYALDKWTNDLDEQTSADGKFTFSDVAVGSTIVATANFDSDSKGDPEDPDNKGDGIPDKYQVYVKYEAGENGTVEGKGEVFTSEKNEDGTYAETVSFTTVADVTVVPDEGYALDKWTNDLDEQTSADGKFTFSDVAVGSTIVATANFDSDSKGDPEDPDNKGDGIPDKYQVYVKYEAGENGTVEGKGEVFTSEKNEDGTYAETVSFTTVADVTVTPNEGYALDIWTNDLDEQTSVDGIFTFSDVAVGTTIVATANFDTDTKGDPEDPENKGDGIPDKYQVAVSYNIEHGKWDNGSTVKTAYVNKYDEEGNLAEDGVALLGDTVPTMDQVKPDFGYMAHGIWTPEQPFANTPVSEDTDFTITLTDYSYFYTRGENSVYTKGTNEDVKVTVNRSVYDDTTFSHFTGVKIDGEELKADEFDAVAGSVVVTLKSKMLEKLAVGEHNLTVMFDDGSATTKLYIKEKSEPVDNTDKTAGSGTAKPVHTGDRNNITFYAGLIGLAVLISLLMAVVRIKRKESR